MFRLIAPVLLAGCAPARAPEPVAAPEGAVRILVSRSEIRAIFPRDTARSWGWDAPQDRDYLPRYAWSIGFDGMDGPRSLELTADGRRNGVVTPRRFGSLDELVAAGYVGLCRQGMIADCRGSGTAAWVENGSVVLALRDSAVIARLLGLRPERLAVGMGRPGIYRYTPPDIAVVEYVDPQIPEPDSALRAEAARSRRANEAADTRIGRHLHATPESDGVVWVATGDSTAFLVTESFCQSDVCRSLRAELSAAGWTAADSSIVELRPYVNPRRPPSRTPMITAVGRRAGETRVRVHGLSGPSDTMPNSTPLPRELERAIRVTEPVGSVRLSPRVREARADEPVVLRGEVRDTRGRAIEGVPFRVDFGMTPRVQETRFGPAPVQLSFDRAGRYTVVASFGGRADTLVVDVLPRRDSTAVHPR